MIQATFLFLYCPPKKTFFHCCSVVSPGALKKTFVGYFVVYFLINVLLLVWFCWFAGWLDDVGCGVSQNLLVATWPSYSSCVGHLCCLRRGIVDLLVWMVGWSFSVLA